MGRIQILSDHVANQIAAGEVIERPAAVVKELMENSIDAGASRVEIRFRNGGKDSIRVEDNGCGMTKDEALMALERHATSKIRDIRDLEKIYSLGFRGEALPSIASVSRFTMKTRAKENDCGSQIIVDAGKLIENKDCGMPKGTIIEVEELFHKLPARRKFLKTENTEAAHIIYLARLAAITRPEVAFTLIENEKTLFRSPTCSQLIDRIGEVFGTSKIADLLDLENKQDNGLSLYGLIGKPGVGRSTRSELITIVNGRPIESRALNYAIIESYHTLIPKGRYPTAFLFLELDPALVDVNMHPAKREARFRNEGTVRQFIIEALLERLRKAKPALPASAYLSDRSDRSSTPQDTTLGKFAYKPEASSNINNTRNPAEPPPAALSTSSLSSPSLKNSNPPETPTRSYTNGAKTSLPEHKPQPLLSWKFLESTAQGYALFETTENSLIILNPLYAERRIVFETLKKQFARQEKPTQQPLLLPLSIELDPLSIAAFEKNRTYLETIGFTVEPFGRQTFRVEALPDWVEPSKATFLLEALIAHFREGGLTQSISVAHETLARIASKHVSQTKANTDPEHLKKVAARLLACDNPLIEPSGKPTFIEMTSSELRKKFAS